MVPATLATPFEGNGLLNDFGIADVVEVRAVAAVLLPDQAAEVHLVADSILRGNRDGQLVRPHLAVDDAVAAVRLGHLPGGFLLGRPLWRPGRRPCRCSLRFDPCDKGQAGEEYARPPDKASM